MPKDLFRNLFNTIDDELLEDSENSKIFNSNNSLNVKPRSKEGSRDKLNKSTGENYFDSRSNNSNRENGSIDMNNDVSFALSDIKELSDNSSESEFFNLRRKNLYDNLKYRDFDTIDWLKENIKYKREVHETIQNYDEVGGPYSFLKKMILKVSGWLVGILVGILTALSGFFLYTGSEWLIDLREGYCSLSFFGTYSYCCPKDSTNDPFNLSLCSSWVKYSVAAGLKAGKNAIAFDYAMYVLISAFYAFLSAFFVKTLAPYACSDGLAEIQTYLSGFVIRGYLGIRTFIVKYMSFFLSSASGLNVSIEGAMIHAGCSLANFICRFFPKFYDNEAKKREMIGAGAAAGFCSPFFAPVSGLLFGLERICYYFSAKTLYRTFLCVLVAVSLHYYISVQVESNVFLLFKNDMLWNLFQLIPIGLMAVFGGILGAFFKIILVKWSAFRKAYLWRYTTYEVVILAVVTALSTYPFVIMHGSNERIFRKLTVSCNPYFDSLLCNYDIPPIVRVMDNSQPHVYYNVTQKGLLHHLTWQMLLLSLLKLVLTALTVTARIPTGILYPVLTSGAMFGRAIGLVLEMISSYYSKSSLISYFCMPSSTHCVYPELYAILGAAAFLGGVTHMTITLVVFIMEFSRTALLIVPSMFVIMIAKLVSSSLYPKSFMEARIQLNNYPYLKKIPANLNKKLLLTTKTLCQYKSTDSHKCFHLVSTGMSVSRLFGILSKDFYAYPLLDNDDDMRLLAMVKRVDILREIGHVSKFTEPGYQNRSVEFVVSGTSTSLKDVFYLSKCIDYDFLQVDEHTPVDVLADVFVNLGARNVMVTSNGKFKDIVTKKDILEFLA